MIEIVALVAILAAGLALWMWRRSEERLGEARGELLELTRENAALTEAQKGHEERLREARDLKDKLAKEFELLAHKIFQERGQTLQRDHEKMLAPLRERLGEFQEKLTRYREDEIREATGLKNEIAQMLKLNQKLSADAENLTRALRGDNKLQGNWGELVLQRVLEASGLREGEEYVLQGEGLGLRADEGQVQRPDVIVHLPEGKCIIVDAKVSLLSYERYISATEPALRDLALREFVASLEKHIQGLSDKKYHQLEKLLTPEFVLLFVPTEGAFATALQSDHSLFSYAWERKIILVSPTTLMVTLRTVESIWRQEKQSKNALEIARQGGEIYDKFVGFVGDMDKLRGTLELGLRHHGEAYNKLKTGRGSIVSRLEKMRELGAKSTKTLELEAQD